ncbi:MAG: class I SAM-dependent methyltransferase [Bacteroidia bacterium]|nr:class I SAM-dependent methyltransferase [Bacteroidia bacterium]
MAELNFVLMKDVSENVQNTYDNQYKNSDAEWRRLGGLQKSGNIIKLCSKLNAKNMLDVGSGDGAVLSFLDKNNFCPKIDSLEISDSGIERIKSLNLKHLNAVTKFDGYNIPFQDKSFELATCSHVLEHVEHPRLLLREIARVSQYQFFEIPIDFSFFVDNKMKHYLDYGHINIFTPALFKFLLKSEGFQVLDEEFIFLSNDLIRFAYKGNTSKILAQKIKNFLISSSPYRKVKPSAYTVLCQHDGQGLKIF